MSANLAISTRNLVRSIRGKLLEKAGYRLVRLDRVLFFDALIEKLASTKKEIYVAQVGANDGITYDPIRPFLVKYHEKVKAVLVEPIQSHFANLQKNYAGYPNIVTAKLAIHNTEREMTMYKVDETKLPELPGHAIGIASFNNAHHQNAGIPKSAIIEEKVNCLPLHELVSSYRLPSVDILQIDAEGYDAEILLGLDFEKVRPSVIHFEHGVRQGTISRSTFERLCDHLHSKGYEIALEDGDATAYLRSLLLEA